MNNNTKREIQNHDSVWMASIFFPSAVADGAYGHRIVVRLRCIMTKHTIFQVDKGSPSFLFYMPCSCCLDRFCSSLEVSICISPVELARILPEEVRSLVTCLLLTTLFDASDIGLQLTLDLREFLFEKSVLLFTICFAFFSLD